jgi:hypothetical protein
MKKLFFLVALFAITVQTQAASSETIKFNGQNGDSLSLDIINTVVRYKDEVRDTTCTRQIPYETEECGYETRYRQECRFEPGRNVCRTEYENRCRTVTRYRQECRRGPDRRVCRTTDPRRICRNGTCRTEPGRRICDTKPGERICRRVPYQDRECTREPRQVCTWQPGRNVCNDVPYQEWVCRTVTRYRSEDYPCRRTFKVPYNFDRKVKADVEVTYKDQSINGLVDFIFSLTEDGDVTLKANDNSRKPVLVGVNKVVTPDVQDDETNTQANFSISLFDQETELAPIKKNIQSGGLSKTAAWFTVGKVTKPERLKVTVVITRKTILGNTRTPFSKVLTAQDFTMKNNNGGTKILVDLSKFGVELKEKKWTMNVEVALSFEGNIINRSREPLKKNQSFTIDVN